MSVKKSAPPGVDRTPFIFAGALILMCLIWLFGIALRVSLREDIDIVARAGISRVLDGGFSDFRDTTFLIVVASGCYLACLWALRKGFRHDFAAAIAGTIVAGLAMLPAMPLTSPDAVHLAADVRTFWIQREDPTNFDGAPGKFDDPVANEVRVFRNQPSGYGPLAYAIGGAPLPFVGDSFRANLLGQKVMGGIFLTLTALASGLLARRLGQKPALIAGIVGLNPMMTWQFPGDGHNDAMMAFFGVVALGLVVEPAWRLRSAGVVAGLASAACKYALILAAPVVAAYWWPRFRYPLAFLAAAGGGLVLMLYVTGAGPIENGALGPAGAVIETSPWHLLQLAFDTGTSGDDRIVVASYMLYLFILGLIMIYHPLDSKTDLVAAVGMAMTFFLYFCSPGYHPWYIIWCLPFAAMSNRRWLMVGAVAFTLAAFLPILALNWRITLGQTWNLSNPVEWFTVTMWLATAAAAYVGWRGKDWTSFSRPAAAKSGPKFAPRQRKRAGA